LNINLVNHLVKHGSISTVEEIKQIPWRLDSLDQFKIEEIIVDQLNY